MENFDGTEPKVQCKFVVLVVPAGSYKNELLAEEAIDPVRVGDEPRGRGGALPELDLVAVRFLAFPTHCKSALKDL